MNKIYLFNETDENLKAEIKKIKKLLVFALKKDKLKNIEFNVIFVDNERIQDINKNYRNIDKVTDVISFALEDRKDVETKIRLLGDIYISIDRAKEQALEYGHSFTREISFLSVHGLLHLLGYDHMVEQEEKIMFKKQEDILNEYGIRR